MLQYTLIFESSNCRYSKENIGCGLVFFVSEIQLANNLLDIAKSYSPRYCLVAFFSRDSQLGIFAIVLLGCASNISSSFEALYDWGYAMYIILYTYYMYISVF